MCLCHRAAIYTGHRKRQSSGSPYFDPSRHTYRMVTSGVHQSTSVSLFLRSIASESLNILLLDRFSSTPIINLAWLPGNLLFVSNGVQALVLSRDLFLEGHSAKIVQIVQAAQAPLPDAHPENLVQCVIWGE
jgi:hypothetical protein